MGRMDQIGLWTLGTEEVSPGSSGPRLPAEYPLDLYAGLDQSLWDMAERLYDRFGNGLIYIGPRRERA